MSLEKYKGIFPAFYACYDSEGNVSTAATKAFVLSLSRGIAAELKDQEIYVTAVCPGPVQTEFFLQEGMQVAAWKEPFLASAELVVKKALKDAYKNKTISVYGFSMNMMRILMKIFPKSLFISITRILQKRMHK